MCCPFYAPMFLLTAKNFCPRQEKLYWRPCIQITKLGTNRPSSWHRQTLNVLRWHSANRTVPKNFGRERSLKFREKWKNFYSLRSRRNFCISISAAIKKSPFAWLEAEKIWHRTESRKNLALGPKSLVLYCTHKMLTIPEFNGEAATTDDETHRPSARRASQSSVVASPMPGMSLRSAHGKNALPITLNVHVEINQ